MTTTEPSEPRRRAVMALESAEKAIETGRLGLAGVLADIGTAWATLHVGDSIAADLGPDEEDS